MMVVLDSLGARFRGFFFFSSRRRHTRFDCDWSSDVCSSDLENLEAAERPAPPEHDRDEEADDDRRQPHPRVHGAHDEPAPREAREGKRRPGGNADQQRDQRRAPRDLEREPEDRPDLAVALHEQPERLSHPVEQQGHDVTSPSRLPAIGTNSGWPYRSTPKVLMIRWTSGETMKSANALPPAVLTRGPFAGLTSITE